MKLSLETLGILKNFAGINASIVVPKGSKLSTLSNAKNILGEAEIKEKFPVPFAIYDLSEFLGAIALFGKDAEFEFKDQYVVVSLGTSRIRYMFGDPTGIIAPTAPITMPAADITVQLSKTDLEAIMKAAGVLNVPDLAVKSDGDDIIMEVLDKKNTSTNRYSVSLGKGNGKKFTFYFKVENIKVIPDDYDLALSSQLISQFTGKNAGVTYWIALESDSTYGK